MQWYYSKDGTQHGPVEGYLCVAGLAIFAIYFFTLFGVAMSGSGF